jgi:hypothetical protein
MQSKRYGILTKSLITNIKIRKLKLFFLFKKPLQSTLATQASGVFGCGKAGAAQGGQTGCSEHCG